MLGLLLHLGLVYHHLVLTWTGEEGGEEVCVEVCVCVEVAVCVEVEVCVWRWRCVRRWRCVEVDVEVEV